MKTRLPVGFVGVAVLAVLAFGAWRMTRRQSFDGKWVGTYRDNVVRLSGKDPAKRLVATRTGSLDCAARIPVPKRQPLPPSDTANQRGDAGVIRLADDFDSRQRALDATPLKRLLLEPADAISENNLDLAISQRLRAKFHERSWSGLNQVERNIIAIEIMSGEVDNGGFHQFLSNSSGNYAVNVEPALEAIGPPAIAEIYRCVLTAFPNSNPSIDRDERGNQLDAWGEEQFDLFDRLDHAFYAQEDALSSAIVAYARAHAAELDLPPLAK